MQTSTNQNHRARLRTMRPTKAPIQVLEVSPEVIRKLPGTCWDKYKGKWRAYARVDGTKKHLGYYQTQQAAYEVAQAYKE